MPTPSGSPSVGSTSSPCSDPRGDRERLLAAKASKSLCRNILAPIKQTYEWLIDDRGLALQNPAVRLGKFLHETIDKKKRVARLRVRSRKEERAGSSPALVF